MTPRKKKAKKKKAKKADASLEHGTTERHPATKHLPDEYVWDVERDGPQPMRWRRSPPPIPCPECGATRNVFGSQALISNGVHETKAYAVCRVCFTNHVLDLEEPHVAP